MGADTYHLCGGLSQRAALDNLNNLNNLNNWATADFLRNQAAVPGDRLGVVGFCMGGQLTLLTATINPNI